MLRVLVTALLVMLLVHTAAYWWRVRAIRAASGARLPVGADGVIPGATAITLRGSATHAALVIHGFGDTPQTVAGLSAYLHDVRGWSVRAPLLPGHGRTLADFDDCGSTAWRTAVHDEYVAMRSQFDTVVLIGLSMGGALVTIEASHDDALPALVLLAPYLTPPASAQRLAPLATLINLVVPYLRGGDRARSIFDPAARAQVLGYSATPPKRVRDLVAVASDARFAAAAVHAPVLLMHSRTDYRIPVALAESHAALFTHAAACEQRWVDGGGHVITVDHCRERVWEATADWLDRFAGAPRATDERVS